MAVQVAGTEFGPMMGRAGHGLGARAGLVVLGVIVGCESSVPRFKPPPKPAEPRVSVRLFEKHGPTQIAIEVPHRITVLGKTGKIASSSRVELDGAHVLVDGEQQTTRVIVEPLYDHVKVMVNDTRTRKIAGKLTFTKEGRGLRVMADLTLEDYVSGVVAAEMASAHPEAHRAQAIVTRTYALRQRGRHKTHDFCDLTHCQVFRGVPSDRIISRVKSTAGLYLADAHGPAEVFFGSTCGGHTANAHRTFGVSPSAALEGVSDLDASERPWCAASPHATWRFSVSSDRLADTFRAPRPARLRLNRDPAGWVTQVHFEGLKRPLTGSQFHRRMGRRFGWGAFKSAFFEIDEREGKIEFRGRGLGHGVGLCQYGAMARAKAGQDAEAILKHYFPGLVLTHL